MTGPARRRARSSRQRRTAVGARTLRRKALRNPVGLQEAAGSDRAPVTSPVGPRTLSEGCEMSVAEEHRGGQLNRSVGFYGLMFVSLGSIIGSGWLLGALTAAETAGPGVDHLLGAGRGDAGHPRPGLRRAGRDLPGRRRLRPVPLLLPRTRSPGSSAAGRPGCRPCSSRRSRCWPRSPTSTASPGSTRTSRCSILEASAQLPRPGRRHPPDAALHRDQPDGRRVHVREQHLSW